MSKKTVKKRKYVRNPVEREKVILNFRPDFARIKQYDRKYINLPYDTVTNEKFVNLPASVSKLFIVLGIFSFEKAEADGWFPVTMDELEKRSKMSINTIRQAKNYLIANHFLDVGLAYRKDCNIHYSDCYRINGFVTLVKSNNDTNKTW